MKDNLFQKFLKFSYGSWLGLILGLLTTMLSTRLLLPEAFGKASMFDMVLQVALILTVLGNDQAFIRFFSEDESKNRGALFYNTLKVPIISTIFIVSLTLLLYKSITTFLTGSANLTIALVLCLGMVSNLLFRFGQLVIRMQQKGNLYSLLQIFQKAFNLVFILLLFYLIGNTFEVLVFARVLTLVFLVIITIYFGRNFWSLNNLSVKNVKHSQVEIFRYGTPFVLTTFITWLFESFDKIALRQWSSFEELGIYAAAMKLVVLLMVLRQTFSTFWSPVAYEKFENDPMNKDFFRYMSVIVSFGVFLVAIISIAGKDLIVVLLGVEYRGASHIMPFLVFMPILYTISQTTVMGINFYKKTHWHIVISLISCTINILGNWWLVPQLGALGASISTALSFVVFFILRTQISLKLYKVNYPLFKIYTMLITVIAYATFTIFYSSLWVNILIGIVSTIILIIIFYNDLLYIYKNRKQLLNN